jgi:exopolysaccharide biosynthesis polyprenyl glycosylphosphotransferase
VLLTADVVGLLVAFMVAEISLGALNGGNIRRDVLELAVLFVLSLPLWVLMAKFYGLYDHDEERTDHSTTDDFGGVFHLVTVGVWVLYAGAWMSGVTTPDLEKTVTFWAAAIVALSVARATGRSLIRRSPGYIQNTIIVGAGAVGQLVARKYLQHPEYGIRLVAVVDDEPRERRDELEGIELRTIDELPELIRERDVDRIVIAFSSISEADTVELVRELRKSEIQIDVVPRLFDVVTPKAGMHSVEGLALMGLLPARMSRSSGYVKRAIDLVGALLLLVLTAPLFVYCAWRVRRSSPGPILFRQTRLGKDMNEFTALKFRTMTVGDNDDAHREYVGSIMSPNARATDSGLYKLDRPEVTRFGGRLRATSLDELPQLINILRGEMSLVGPRPCIEYETRYYAPHHFERFAMPAGLTGLWQVTARAKTSFAEALDLDVTYVRGWSLRLDLSILARTPVQVVKRRGAV